MSYIYDNNDFITITRKKPKNIFNKSQSANDEKNNLPDYNYIETEILDERIESLKNYSNLNEDDLIIIDFLIKNHKRCSHSRKYSLKIIKKLRKKSNIDYKINLSDIIFIDHVLSYNVDRYPISPYNDKYSKIIVCYEFFIQKKIKNSSALQFYKSKEVSPPILYSEHPLDINLTKLLINKKANINFKNKDGNTPLISACKASADADVLKLLIDAKANIYHKNNNNETAINALRHTNCRDTYGQIDLLIMSNADINSQNNYGNSPLMFWCKYGSGKKNDLLIYIRHHVDMNLMNNKNEFAVSLICARINQIYREFNDAMDLDLKCIIGYRFDINDTLECMIENKACVDLNNDNSALNAIEHDSNIIPVIVLIKEYIRTNNTNFVDYILAHEIMLNNIRDFNADSFALYLKMIPFFHNKLLSMIKKEINDNTSVIGKSFGKYGDVNIVKIIVEYAY